MSVQAPVRGPRARGLRIAVIVWLVLLVVAVGVTVWRLVDYTSRPADQRVPAAGGTVSIVEPGEYSIYADSGSQYGDWGSVSSVTGPSGAAVPIGRPTVSETYTAGTRSGVRIGTFTADQAGPYTMTGVADGAAPGDQLVVGSRTVGALVAVVFGGVATGLLLVAGLIGGLVMLLVGRRRTPVPAGPWGAGPPPPGWTPPPPGWTPQQGGPAPGWAPPQPGRTPQQGGPAPGWAPPQHGGQPRQAPPAWIPPQPPHGQAPQPGAPYASNPSGQREADAARPGPRPPAGEDSTVTVRPSDRDDPTSRG